MEITEVRIKLMDDSDDRLQAFCSITFDDAFVVRDLKIIDGTNGPFVAMPSRKLTSHCPECGAKNHMRANYCNQCGKRQPSERGNREGEGRAKLYADIAHPINSACREMIQDRVIAEFQEELERAKAPGYISRYDDEYDDFDAEQADALRERSSTGRWDQAHAPHESRTRQVGRTSATPPPSGDDPSRHSNEASSTSADGTTNRGVEAAEEPTSSDRAELKGPHSPARRAPTQSESAAESRQSSSDVDPSDRGFGAGIFDE